MDMWKMEQFEIGAQAYEEMEAWFAYEQDMASMSEDAPSDEEMDTMAQFYGQN